MAYAMVLDDKLDIKIIKYLFFGYCKDTKVYNLMCVWKCRVLKFLVLKYV